MKNRGVKDNYEGACYIERMEGVIKATRKATIDISEGKKKKIQEGKRNSINYERERIIIYTLSIYVHIEKERT